MMRCEIASAAHDRLLTNADAMAVAASSATIGCSALQAAPGFFYKLSYGVSNLLIGVHRCTHLCTQAYDGCTPWGIPEYEDRDVLQDMMRTQATQFLYFGPGQDSPELQLKKALSKPVVRCWRCISNDSGLGGGRYILAAAGMPVVSGLCGGGSCGRAALPSPCTPQKLRPLVHVSRQIPTPHCNNIGCAVLACNVLPCVCVRVSIVCVREHGCMQRASMCVCV